MSTYISAEGQGTQAQQRTRFFLSGRADSICSADRIMHAEYGGVGERDIRRITEHAHSGSTDLNRCSLHSLYAVGVLPPRTLTKGIVLASWFSLSAWIRSDTELSYPAGFHVQSRGHLFLGHSVSGISTLRCGCCAIRG
jgi:hypothetical protein